MIGQACAGWLKSALVTGDSRHYMRFRDVSQRLQKRLLPSRLVDGGEAFG